MAVFLRRRSKVNTLTAKSVAEKIMSLSIDKAFFLAIISIKYIGNIDNDL